MKEYQTEQRKSLFSFLTRHQDRQFTIEELAQSIDGISISALYRNVNHLVKEGAIQRFQKEGSRKFSYQYIGDAACAEHIHLKCTHCGRILHMDQKSMEIVIKAVRNNISFDIDTHKTILFGSCKSCR